MQAQPVTVMVCISLAHSEAHLLLVQGAASLHPVEWFIRFENMPVEEPLCLAALPALGTPRLNPC